MWWLYQYSKNELLQITTSLAFILISPKSESLNPSQGTWGDTKITWCYKFCEKAAQVCDLSDRVSLHDLCFLYDDIYSVLKNNKCHVCLFSSHCFINKSFLLNIRFRVLKIQQNKKKLKEISNKIYQTTYESLNCSIRYGVQIAWNIFSILYCCFFGPRKFSILGQQSDSLDLAWRPHLHPLYC